MSCDLDHVTVHECHVAILSPGNELSRVEGLEGLENLIELVLDRNKVKVSCHSPNQTRLCIIVISLKFRPVFARELCFFAERTERAPLGGEQVE